MTSHTIPTSTASAIPSAPGATSPTTSSTSPSNPSPTSPTSAPSQATPTIAVAFYTLEPTTKTHRIRPGVASSLSPLTIIASSPTAASSHIQPGVVDAFNAATDLVMYLDGQMSKPPSAGETLTGLFRPASAELGGRLKKLGEKVKLGKVNPEGKGGEWKGERSVQEMNWEEFSKVFGKD